MAINSKLSDDGKILSLDMPKRFDINIHSDFEKAYQDKIGKISKLVIDMANTEYLDSSGMGMLLVLRENIGEGNAEIEITNTTKNIKTILKIANFEKLFKIE